MLRLTLSCLVAQASALALQPVLGRGSAAAVRSAVSMQVDWEARKAAEEQAKADAHAALLAHLRSPIRQYEGGWGDTALRGGGKDAKRFGTGPDGNLDKDFAEDGEELIEHAMHAPLRDVGRRKGKYSSAFIELSSEKQEQLVLPEESFKVTKMEMSQTDDDFVMECAAGEEAELVIDIEPMFLTKTEYFYGFTADSDPKISVEREISSVVEGEMPAKGHKGNAEDAEDIQINIKFKPESATGEFEAHLCVIFPNEKAFSKFYKITGKTNSASEATRDPNPAV